MRTRSSRWYGQTRLAIAVAAISILGSASGVAATPPDEHDGPSRASQVAQWVSIRRAYGLSDDPIRVDALAGSTEDVGSADWGIPMTAEEAEAVDINGRNLFVRAAHEQLVPYARSLKSFAGLYVDQLAGGDIVVQLTDINPEAVAAIQARAPKDTRKVRVVAARYPNALLESTARSIAKSRNSLLAGLSFTGVALDTVGNRVRVEIAPGSGHDLRALGERLSATFGVDVVIAEVARSADVVGCTTSRDTCYDPMRAGNRIRDGSVNGENWCTQGFPVKENGTTNVQILTACHCYKLGVSNTWYHKAYGKLGAEDGTAYGEDGYDVMKVEFPNAQVSERIFDVSGTQQNTAARDPITGEGICFSGARTDAIVCGTVQDNLRSWVSETCSCNVWGGDASYTPIKGDSGAPVYARVYITSTGSPYWSHTPIRVNDHENGGFAYVTAAQWVLGVTVYR